MHCADLSILIIDDNPAEIDLLRESFHEECRGIQLRHIATVHEALTHIRTTAPAQVSDAVLVDYRLPRSSGVEVIAALVQHAHWQRVPCIVMTSSLDPLMQEHCRHAGAPEIFVKPSDFDGYLTFARTLTRRMRQAKPRPSS